MMKHLLSWKGANIMERCGVCGREISENNHNLIRSRGKELKFFSNECVKKYIKNKEEQCKREYEGRKRIPQGQAGNYKMINELNIQPQL